MNSNHKNYIVSISEIKHQRWIVAGCTMVICVIFFLFSNLQNQPGFPLDDAWIHQTYARNLAQSGGWEYVPGQASGGSTSPLWTILLSFGFMLGLKTPFLWTTLLSTGMMIGIALVINETLQHFFQKTPIIGIAGSLFVILDWHLLWSAASGMETLFYCLVSIYIFWILLGGKYWGWLGSLCGLIVWIRPDGITMLGPVILLMLIQIIAQKFRFKDGMFFLIPLFVLLALYGLFNYSISGSVFPNTFYAKQSEYASVLQQPFSDRLGHILLVPISGAGIFLIPGFVFALFQTVKKQNWWMLAAILWFLGYGVLYAMRLPMTYQHGRYLFPMIPVYLLIGLIGTVQLISTNNKINLKVQKFIKPAVVGMFLCSVIFMITGMQGLTTDIQTIDRLMVQPAIWIKENTEIDALVAVHDIGAMGYFGERKIIDLAGLIQPELIPIIRNDEEIKRYLIEKNVDYLVVFENWYPGLTDFGSVVTNFSLETPSGIETVEIKIIR